MIHRRDVRGEFHRFKENVTWAGECPWTQDFCFGTENGKLIVPPRNMMELEPAGVTEAINGVAFFENVFGVSTRNEVAILRLNPSAVRVDLMRKFDGGAHGLISTSPGRFVASLGENGLLFVRSTSDQVDLFKGGGIKDSIINYYQLAVLGKHKYEAFACAARNSGVLGIAYDWDGNRCSIAQHRFPRLDIVDVYPLRSPAFPLAAVAVSRDGTLLLSRDILHDRPVALRLWDQTTTVYSVLSIGGHLFVLTRTALHVLPGFAARFLAGERLDQPTPISDMPVDAAFVNLAYDRFLLLVLGDEVFSVEIAKLLPATDSTESDLQFSDITPRMSLLPLEQVHEFDLVTTAG